MKLSAKLMAVVFAGAVTGCDSASVSECKAARAASQNQRAGHSAVIAFASQSKPSPCFAVVEGPNAGRVFCLGRE